MLGEIHETIASIDEELPRARALSTLAASLAQAGHYERAKATADNILEEVLYDNCLKQIVVEMASRSQFDEAQALAEKISGERVRISALRTLVVALAKETLFDRAVAITESNNDEASKAKMQRDLVYYFAVAGEFEQGLELCRSINRQKFATEAAWCLMVEFAGASQVSNALDMIEFIADTTNFWSDKLCTRISRDSAFVTLSNKLIDTGKYDVALEIIKRVGDNNDALRKAYRKLAKNLADIRDERANNVFGAYQKLSQSGRRKASRFGDGRQGYELLASKLIEHGHFEIGRRGTVLLDKHSHDNILQLLVASLAEHGNYVTALEVANEVQESDDFHNPNSAHDKAIITIAAAYIEDENFAAANSITDLITDERAKTRLLIDIMVAMARVSSSEVDQMTETIHQLINAMSDPEQVIEMLGRLVIVLANIAHASLEDRLKGAQTFIDNIPKDDQAQRDRCLSHLALSLARIERYEDAMTRIERMSDDDRRSSTQRQLLGIAIKNSRLDEAQKILPLLADERDGNWARRMLAIGLAEHGFVDTAKEFAAQITNDSDREDTYRDLLDYFIEVRAFDDAQAILKLLPIKPSRLRSTRTSRLEATNMLVTEVVETGQHERAIKIINATVPEIQDEAYSHAVIASAKAAQFGKAYELLDSVSESLRSSTIHQLAIVLANNGRLKEAQSLIDATDQKSDPELLYHFAIAMVNDRDLIEARQIAEMIEDNHALDEILRAIVKVLAEDGQFDEAYKITTKLSENRREDALRMLFEYMLQNGLIRMAFETLGPVETDRFMEIILFGWDYFEQIEQNLGFRVLKGCAPILGWINTDWNKWAEVLSKSSNATSIP